MGFITNLIGDFLTCIVYILILSLTKHYKIVMSCRKRRIITKRGTKVDPLLEGMSNHLSFIYTINFGFKGNRRNSFYLRTCGCNICTCVNIHTKCVFQRLFDKILHRWVV